MEARAASTTILVKEGMGEVVLAGVPRCPPASQGWNGSKAGAHGNVPLLAF